MAEIWAAAVATVAAGAIAANGAKKAGESARHGADAATAETSRQYDQTRNDLAPYRAAGGNALDEISRLYGWAPASGAAQREADLQPVYHGGQALPQGSTVVRTQGNNYDVMYQGQRIGGLSQGGPDGRFTPAAGVNVDQLLADQQTQARSQQATGAPSGGTGQPDMSHFFSSPDYNFRRTEGQRGIEGTFAARGMGQSGNALRALTDFNSNLAAGEFGNYFNRLAGIAGVGQTATNQTGAFGADAASQASRNSLYAGNARASGIQGQSDAWGQTGQGLASLYGYYKNPNRGGGGGGGGYTNYINAGGITG
jgi:hypothetical protein